VPSRPVAWTCGACKGYLWGYPTSVYMRCVKRDCSEYAVPFRNPDMEPVTSSAATPAQEV